MNDLDYLREIEEVLGFKLEEARDYNIDSDQNVTELYLRDFDLTNISFLKELKNLSSLYLSNNKLTDISVLKELKNLSSLDLSDNKLTDISALEKLNKLTSLDLSDNKLANISALKKLNDLTRLDLSDNKLTDISALKYLKNISYLNLAKNPIKEPNEDIIALGPRQIREYFESEEKERKNNLYEAKIVILGERKAGKTTLFKKLQKSKELLPKTESTLGVDVIKNYKFTHPTKKNTQITTTIWDFDGNTIQYHLHKYFITKDALYIIVADYRKTDINWDYWFNIINSLKKKDEDDTLPKVLVVLNFYEHYDSNNALKTNKNRKKFNKHLLDIEKIEVDFSKNDNKWCKLQKIIVENLITLPIVLEKFSQKLQWKELKEKLAKEKKNYISKKQFYSLCPKGLDDEKDKLRALDYFNKTGNLIHFPDDLALSNIIFLQPNWIAKALYASLSSGNENMGKGFLGKKWIFDFWQKQTEEKYQEPDCNYLLNLMLKDKLNIAYEVEEEKYMVPILLPCAPPKEKYEWNFKDNISIRIKYEEYKSISSIIITNLIVRMYDIIYNNLVWREGIILKNKDSDATALIIQENEHLLSINIANGSLNAQKELLYKIQNEIKTIHKKLYHSEIDYKESVKCNCHKCNKNSSEHSYIEMKKIKHLSEKCNKQHIQCPKFGDPVSITNLIGTVYKQKKIEEKSEMKEKTEKKSKNEQTVINNIIQNNSSNINNNTQDNINNNTIHFINEEKITKELITKILDFLENNKESYWKDLKKEEIKTLNNYINDIKKENNNPKPNKKFLKGLLNKTYDLFKNITVGVAENVAIKTIIGIFENL